MKSPWLSHQLLRWGAVLCVLRYLHRQVTATHFRGVHMWYDSTALENQANIVFRVAWRRTYKENPTYCDDNTIIGGQLIGPPGGGNIVCTNCVAGDTTAVGNLLFACTDYSVSEDWTAGIGNHTTAFPGAGPFELRWEGTGWLEGVFVASDAPWSTRLVVNLAVRSDTGRVNSSPRSAVPPIMRLQFGCNHTIALPVSDPDKDIVRCRWATRENNECGGVCQSISTAQLEPDCVLRYTANQQAGYHAAAIQLEDFASEDSVVPLSSAPLQFLLLVYEPDEGYPEGQASCDVKPEFVDPTPEADTCMYIASDREHTIQIVVRLKDDQVQLREVQTVSSVGMRKTEIYDYGTDGREHAVNVTWLPGTRALRSTETIFCYTAVDIGGVSSEQRCLFLVVGEVTPPRFSFVAFSNSTRIVSIAFDQPVRQTSRPVEIYVHLASDGRALLSLSAADSSRVTVDGNTLSFVLPESFTDSDYQLYILLDQGVVTGAQSTNCGLESEAVRDQTTIQFSTLDSLPPPNQTPLPVATGAPPSGTSSDPSLTTVGASNEPSTNNTAKDYTWLIVVIVCLIVVFAIITVVAVCVRRHQKAKDNYSRENRQEEYTRSVASKMATTNGAYTPDFNDIDVKFR